MSAMRLQTTRVSHYDANMIITNSQGNRQIIVQPGPRFASANNQQPSGSGWEFGKSCQVQGGPPPPLDTYVRMSWDLKNGIHREYKYGPATLADSDELDRRIDYNVAIASGTAHPGRNYNAGVRGTEYEVVDS